MIIRSIEVSNVGPFLGEWEVELSDGVNAIVGEYEGADASSNRSGKSFLAVDVPRFVLHGTFRGRKLDDLVHRKARGKEKGVATLKVENSSGRIYTLSRGRSAGGEPIRTIDGRDLSDEDFRKIVFDEVLGLSEEEHRLTTLFVQGRISEFMEMTASEKRRVVSPWFRTDRWVPRADLARRRLNAAKTKLSGLRAREKELSEIDEVKLERARERETVAKKEVEAAGKRRAEAALFVDRGRAELKRIRGEASTLKAAEEAVDTLAGVVYLRKQKAAEEIEKAQRAVAAANTELAEAESRKIRISELEKIATQVPELREAVAKVEAEIKAAAREKKEATEERERLADTYRTSKKTRTGVCPVLSEPCDRIVPDEAKLVEIRTRGLVLNRSLARVEKEHQAALWRRETSEMDLGGAQDAERQLDRLRALPSITELRERAERRKADLAEAKKVLRSYELGTAPKAQEYADAAAALEKLVKSDAKRKENENRIRVEVAEAEKVLEDHDESISQLTEELDRAREDRVRGESAVVELEKVRRRIEEVSSDVEKLAWSAYAFGATGIPSRELENAFGVAEEAMCQVLEDLGTHLRVAFSPTRELADWEPNCLACGETYPKGFRKSDCPVCGVPRRRRQRDELGIQVVDRGQDTDFELDSGGGKILVSLGVRLGLAKLPSASRSVRCESLIVDEADAALDGPNRKRLHEALRRVDRLGFRQVLLITHSDARNEFPRSVVVHRWDEDDYSGAWNG